ncbi:uncharacterized protein LOC113306140 [Papaver somniferum]|uniref:uncharacterized protein LOC113306140 n=1 Tax=Papaver somniferum TaxID=3469 RepID=UPI000E6F6FF6|nr:uncharacterized protein LOC113306140 [Papaver somniferum]
MVTVFILLINDPWLINHPNSMPELREHTSKNIIKVSDLILQIPTRWNEEKIHQLFQDNSAAQILNTYLPDAEDNIEDQLLWKPHPNGTFSCKSFIKTLKMNQRSSSSVYNDTFPWKNMWNIKDITPNILVFIWRIIHEGLAIFQNLGKHIKGINQDCRLCSTAIEDLEHIFFHCPVTTTTFFGSPLGCRTERYSGMSCKQIIAGWLAEKGNYEAFKMGSCVMWAMWKNRNDKVFNGKNNSIQSIIREAIYWFHYSSSMLPEDELQAHITTLRKAAGKWKPPEDNWIKLNVDVAFDNYKAGWAVVARDSATSFKGCGTNSHEVLSPIEAETRVVLLATDFTVISRLQRVIIESDAEEVIKILNEEKGYIPWILRELIYQIRAKARKVTEVKFVFNKRDWNVVSHTLAKYALSHHSNMWWFS